MSIQVHSPSLANIETQKRKPAENSSLPWVDSLLASQPCSCQLEVCCCLVGCMKANPNLVQVSSLATTVASSRQPSCSRILSRPSVHQPILRPVVLFPGSKV